MKRIWMFAIAAFCLSGNSAIADDTELNACANLLFVNAFKMYTAAANLQGNPRDQELSNIFDILSEIQSIAPTSIPAQRLASGGHLGSMGYQAIKTAATRVKLATETAQKPEFSNLTPAKTHLAKELISKYGDVDELHQVAANAKFAHLATAAYGFDDGNGFRQFHCGDTLPIKGWTAVHSYTFENTVSGDLWATLFRSRGNEYVLAFRGSKQRRDAVVNLSTPVSLITGKISDAVELAHSITQRYPGVTFVGHSLGGRLANIARIVTGNDAIVFDIIPASPAEIRAAGVQSKNQQGSLKSFRAPNDVVSISSADIDIKVANYESYGTTSPLDYLDLVQLSRPAIPTIIELIPAARDNHKMSYLAQSMEVVRIAEPWVVAVIGKIKAQRANEAHQRAVKEQQVQKQLQQKIDAFEAAIQKEVDTFWRTRKGDLETLATVIELDAQKALSLLESGVKLSGFNNQKISTVDFKGRRYFASSAYVRSRLMKHDMQVSEQTALLGYWDISSSAIRPSQITCLFPKISPVPAVDKFVEAKLEIFANTGPRQVLVILICK